MDFGKRLRSLRKGKGLTLQALADLVGVHINTIYKWEQLSHLKDLDRLKQLASIFDVSVATLTGGEVSIASTTATKNVSPVRGDVIEVPVLSSESTACFSNQIEESDIMRYAIIPREWLDGPEGDKTPYIFYIQRDSMDPLIKNGEGLLINPNLEVTHGKIAICCWNGYVMVRGVFFEPNGDLRLLAKNPAYEDVIITAEDAPKVLKFGGVITTCIGRARPIKGFF